MQSNAFKTYLIYVLTVIYSCLCLIKKLRKKEKKEKKGMEERKAELDWTHAWVSWVEALHVL